jgi:hypothetical protein
VDSPIFRELVQKKDATPKVDDYDSESESAKNMINNIQALREFLGGLNAEERSAIANHMMRKCGVVKVVVSDRDRGYSAFRVLNTRGNQPSSNDILKSELFELANFSPEDAASHAIAWNKFGHRLHSQSFDNLLKLIWTIHGKPGDDVLSGFKSKIIPEIGARAFLEDVLPRYVEAYEIVLGLKTPGLGFPEEARNSLVYMRYLEHSGWQIPVLKYFISGDRSAEKVLRFLQAMEKLAYCMQLVKSDSGFRVRRYARLVKAIEAGDDLYSCENAPLLLTQDESQKFSERLDGRFATYRQRRALTLRVNAEVPGGTTIPYESDATLEHILPRNPSPKSGWNKSWPSNNVQREYVDCLGNFTLLNNAENQEADRIEFNAKKAIFFKNGAPSYALTADLMDYPNWTPDEVSMRRKYLADLLRKAWMLD